MDFNIKRFKRCLDPFIHLVYPPLCIHCEEKTKNHRYPFCIDCLEHLTLLESESRCPFCFKEIEGKKICSECLALPLVYTKHAAVCDTMGPSQTLYYQFLSGRLSLAPLIGSLMAMQLIGLKWPMPDLIVPLSISKWKRLQQGENHHTLLAKELAKMAELPLNYSLRTRFDLSVLKDPQSKKFCRFSLNEKEGKALEDKRILIISTGFDREVIQEAAESLREGCPKSIYSLSFL